MRSTITTTLCEILDLVDFNTNVANLLEEDIVICGECRDR